MTKILFVCVFTLMFCAATTAQDLRTYKFQATVSTPPSGMKRLNKDLGTGYKFSGILVYDQSAAMHSADGNARTFNLNDGLSYISLDIGGVTVSTTAFNAPSFNPLGCIFKKVNYSFKEFGRTYQHEKGEFVGHIDQVNGLGELNPHGSAITLSLDSRSRGVGEKLPDDVKQMPDSATIANWDGVGLLLTLSDFKGWSGRLLAKIDALLPATESSRLVNGQLNVDYNANCTVDEEDVGLAYKVLKFEPGGHYAVSNPNGECKVYLEEGEYDIEVHNASAWNLACPQESPKVKVDNSGGEFTIGMQPLEEYHATYVSLGAKDFRPGFTADYAIQIVNFGTLPYSGDLTFRHDALLGGFSSLPAADSYESGTAIWQIENLRFNEVRIINISLAIPADESLLGLELCAEAECLPDELQDEDRLQLSRDEFCQEVGGAFDPNDMQVFVGARNADGEILPEDKWLTYMIRFQNEGSADALTVRIENELSEFHNVDKLSIGAASHEFEVNFTADGKLEWVFEDINLPPKSLDEEGSSGFVKFDIKLKDGLVLGTEITNKASIYFDFNIPIVTNRVVSRIVNSVTDVREHTSGKIGVYNLGDGLYRLSFGKVLNGTLSVCSLVGNTVIKQTIDPSDSILIDLSDQAPGAYFVQLMAADGPVRASLIR